MLVTSATWANFDLSFKNVVVMVYVSPLVISSHPIIQFPQVAFPGVQAKIIKTICGLYTYGKYCKLSSVI